MPSENQSKITDPIAGNDLIRAHADLANALDRADGALKEVESLQRQMTAYTRASIDNAIDQAAALRREHESIGWATGYGVIEQHGH
jgi:hypothetical protein